MRTNYTYQGAYLEIARTADVQKAMRPTGRYSCLVQAILDDMEWVPEGPIETVYFEGCGVWPTAVRVQPDVPRFWGIHTGHKARRPELSPFVVQSVDPKTIGYVTVELVSSPRGPLLVRAYGGDYVPPLPWMSSAENADGGKEVCAEFWRTHAYLLTGLPLLKPDSIHYGEPPEWFSNIQA